MGEYGFYGKSGQPFDLDDNIIILHQHYNAGYNN